MLTFFNVSDQKVSVFHVNFYHKHFKKNNKQATNAATYKYHDT